MGTFLISCLTILVISWNTHIMFFNSHLIHEVQKIQNYILKLLPKFPRKYYNRHLSSKKDVDDFSHHFASSLPGDVPISHLLGIWRELTTYVRHLHLSKTNGFGDFWKMFSLITHVLQKMVKIFRDICDVIEGCGLVLGIFFFFLGAFFWGGSVGFVPAFFPAHVVWLGGVFVVVWWCFCVFVVVFLWWCSCGGVLVVAFLWCFCGVPGGGVFVVVCLGGVFVVVFVWCGCVFVVVWWCFCHCGGVLSFWWCFCSGVFVVVW